MWRRSPNPTGVGRVGFQAGRLGYAGELWAFLFGGIKTKRAFKPVQPIAGKISIMRYSALLVSSAEVVMKGGYLVELLLGSIPHKIPSC
jgi:hypothetical protein